MKTYNVLVGVVELIEAESEADAIRELERRIRAAMLGNPYEGGPCVIPDAFESEDQE